MSVARGLRALVYSAVLISAAAMLRAQSAGELTVGDGPQTVNGVVTLGGDAHPINGDDIAFESAGQRNALVVYGGSTLTLADGADVTVANENNLTAFLRVGYASEGNLVIEDGASLVVGSHDRYANFHIGQGATGRVTQTGGAVTSIGSFNVGVNGGDGTYTIEGGSLTFDHAGIDAGNRTTLISIGFNNATSAVGASSGVFNIDGGLVELSAVEDGGSIGFIIGNRAVDALAAYGGGAAGEGNGAVVQTGGVFRVGAGAGLYLSGYGNGSYALNGGVLEIGGNSLRAQYGNDSDSTYDFSLGGGTIQVIDSALTTSVDFTLTDYVRSFVDTGAFGATWTGNVDGALGGLTKRGEGTFTFAGNATRDIGSFFVIEGDAVQLNGTSTFAEFGVGSGVGSTGEFTLDGGTIILAGEPPFSSPGAASSFRVGDFGGVGVFNHNAGLLVVGSEDASGSFHVGNQGGSGVYNLNGGTLELHAGLHVVGRSDATRPGSQGVINIAGGLLNVKSGGSLFLGNNVANPNTGFSGELNQSGGTLRFDAGTKFYLSAFTTGVYNLTGGVLEIGGNSFNTTYNGNGDGGAFNFGGGSIKVIGIELNTAVRTTLVADTLSTVDTNGEGARFTGAITGEGALVKTGEGALALTGANNFGALLVQEGSATTGNGTTTLGALAVGADGAGEAVFDLTGGVLNIVRADPDRGDMTVGGGAGGDGTLNVTGGVLNVGDADSFSRFFVGAYDGTGLVSQSGGTVNTSGPFNIGNRGGHGTYTLTAGTLNVGQYPAAGDSNALMLGRSRTGQQTNVSRGYLNVGGTGALILNTNTPLLVGGDAGSDANLSRGYVNQTGGTVTVHSWIDLGSRGRGEYDLAGGVLEIGGERGLRSTSGNYWFNLGGGTIKVIGGDLTTDVRAELEEGTVSTINTNGLNATFDSGLGGAGGFAKTGAGALTLNGTTDLQSASTVSGVLKIGAGSGETGVLNLTDDLTVVITNAVGRLQVGVDGGSGTANFNAGASFTVDDSNKTSGWGTLDVGRGAGSVGVLNHSAGLVDMSGGALQVGYSGATGTYRMTNDAEVRLGAGSSLFIGSGAGARGLLTIADDAVFSTVGQVFVGAGTGATGTITQTGGSATFAGTAVWFGTASDETETLNAPGTGIYNLEAGALLFDGLSNGVRFGDSAHGGSGVLNQSGGTITLTNSTLSVGAHGEYSQSGGVIEVGGANLTGSGAYKLGGGTIKVVGSTLTTGMNATLTNARTLTIDTNALDAVFSGSLTGGGGLTKTGLGVLRLTGDSDYSGATSVLAGTFRVDGVLAGTVVNVGNGATLSGHGTVAGVHVAGGGSLILGDSPGRFTITGDLNLADESYTLLKLAGISSYDSIRVDGTLFAGGVLDVQLSGGFVLQEGHSFSLFASDTINGVFSEVWLPSLTSGLEWDVSGLYTAGEIEVIASVIPEPLTWTTLAGGCALALALFRRRRSARG